jgi:hypothetical protein
MSPKRKQLSFCAREIQSTGRTNRVKHDKNARNDGQLSCVG